MSPEVLFATIGDTPEQIKGLRKLAVAMAITGQLNGIESSEAAESLLERIERARDDLSAGKRIPNKPGQLSLDEEDLPEGFEGVSRLVPLGELAQVKKGTTSIKRALPGKYPLIVTGPEPSSCDQFDFQGPAAIIPLVSSTGHGHASINRLHYRDDQFALGTILAAVFPYDPQAISARFLFEYLTAFKDELLVSRMTGTANVTLTIGRIQEVPVPIISPAVQRKLDELMALFDRLETTRTQRETTRDRLTTASLTRLTAPKTTEKEFRAHARFAINTLPTLTTRPDQIKAMRQTILNLAVRGKLVEQDPADEPASELLKRIAIRRSALLDGDYPNPTEAKTQKKKQAQQRLPTDLPEIPPGWTWSTLQQSSLLVIDCKNKTAPYSTSGIKLVRTTNVRDGALNSSDQRFVSEEVYETWSLRAKPEAGDILITREAPMGEVCIIPDGEGVCLGQRMMLVRLVPGTIYSRFMLYSLRDPDLMERVQDKPLGMTVQHLRVGGVETLLVPLPPLAEQHRIVEKVDALMALCDRLEDTLSTADDTRGQLLEGLVQEGLKSLGQDKKAA